MDIIIPIYNRPEYLRRTLQSLKPCLNENTYVILADDGSFNPEIPTICNDFIFSIGGGGMYLRNKNRGIAENLLNVLKELKTTEPIITLDSDFIVKPEFISVLTSLLKVYGNEDTIITGFNATSHPVISTHGTYCIKKTIGGGNICFTWEAFNKHIRQALINNMWDWNMCASINHHKGRFICSTPSVAQHIGTNSTLGHVGADVAIDY